MKINSTALLVPLFILYSNNLEQTEAFNSRIIQQQQRHDTHKYGNYSNSNQRRIIIPPSTSLYHNHRSTKTKSSSSSSSSSSTKQIRNNLNQEITYLGRRGKIEEALQLYNDYINQNKNTKNFVAIKTANLMIDACARARPVLLNTALEVFEDLKRLEVKPNVYTFGALMSCAARLRDSQLALSLLSQMTTEYQIQPNVVVYNSAIRASFDNASTALQLLNQAVTTLPQQDVSAILYNTAMSAVSKTQNFHQVQQLFQQMENSGVIPDEISYATVMSAGERCSEWHSVLHYADLASKQENIILDALGLTSALHACQALGMADRALAYLEQMKNPATVKTNIRKTKGYQRKGVRQPLQGPDDVAYSLAISACSRAGRWTESLRLLREMKGLGIKPDVNVYTSAIDGCAFVGQWKSALALMRQMEREGVAPNVFTYSAAINACASQKAESDDHGTLPKTAALALLQRMKRQGVLPNIVTYNACIKACAEGRDLNKAFDLLDEIRSSYNDNHSNNNNMLHPNCRTFGGLMTACERVADTEAVEKVFHLMDECKVEPNQVIYGAAISCCRKAGEYSRVYTLLQEMVKEAIFPNVITLNTVILAMIEGDKLDTAYKLVKTMEDLHTLPNPNQKTYTMMIKALCLSKKPEEAENLLDSLQLLLDDEKTKSDGSKGVAVTTIDVDLYTATVTAYEKNASPFKALRLMEKMRRVGYNFYDIPLLDELFKRMIRLVNIGK